MNLNRFNWYRIGYGCSFSSLVKELSSHFYSEGVGQGIEVIESTRNRVMAQFTEKKVTREVVEHPFGGVDEYERLSYVTFFFELVYLSKGAAFIRIKNGPSSLKTFITFFSSIAGPQFTVAKIKYGVEDLFLRIVRDESVQRYVVDKVSASSIRLSKSTVAKIDLKSQSNAYDDLVSRYKQGAYRLDKVRSIVRLNGSSETFQLTLTGSVHCSDGVLTLIEDRLVSD